MLDGLIYVTGGYRSGPGQMNQVDVYNPTDQSWHTIAPLAQERAGHGSAVVGRKMYVVGGRKRGDEDLNSLEIFYANATLG